MRILIRKFLLFDAFDSPYRLYMYGIWLKKIASVFRSSLFLWVTANVQLIVLPTAIALLFVETRSGDMNIKSGFSRSDEYWYRSAAQHTTIEMIVWRIIGSPFRGAPDDPLTFFPLNSYELIYATAYQLLLISIILFHYSLPHVSQD